jgi:Arc/MetJ-type ribon-helix-helix transcriptional regulator
MTNETQEAIDDAPQEAPVVADNESTEEQPDVAVDNQETDNQSGDDGGDEVEFPKKAVNALNRKNKQINKLRAQMRELEAKLNEEPEVKEVQSAINPDDFESYGDYINAQVEALVEQKTTQTQSEAQKQMLMQQQEALQAQRDQHIVEQAQEASQVFQDLPQVWQENAALLDALPKEIADIFYSIDNAPAAVYTLAKEGEHPRAYEVAGQLIKTQSEVAQNLLDLQDKLKKIKDIKGDVPKNVTNALFVGSTTELQKMIKKNKDKK